MVGRAPVTASLPTDSPEACPFCGQPLLSTAAVDHLAGQTSAFEARQHQRARAEVEKQLAVTEEAVRARIMTEFANREARLQLTLNKLQEQNSQLSRRVEGLSAGDRGEFTEDDIASQLKVAFPDDEITRTRHGQRGADIFQQVRFRSNGELIGVGLIIYECKDTLQWSNRFVEQIRAQAKLHGTPYAVLVSRRFPRGSSSLAVLDDIVVIEPGRCVALAQIMRRMVIESYRSGVVSGSQAAKTSELFRFISSTQFRQTFDSLTESIDSLDELLTREKQIHQRQWTERQRTHQSISDTLMEIDTHFTSILESNPPPATLHVLRAGKSPA